MELISRRNRILLYENLEVRHLERERGGAHVLDEKSIPASKIEVSREMGDSIPYLVPTWFLSHMAASKMGYQIYNTLNIVHSEFFLGVVMQ
jgi:hypothetical protein